jgi:hypothetical protein
LSVCSTYFCCGDSACVIPPGQSLGAVAFLLGEKFVTSGVHQVKEVRASSDEGGDVSDQWVWKLGEGMFPFTLHLVFDDPAGRTRWRRRGCGEGEINE